MTSEAARAARRRPHGVVAALVGAALLAAAGAAAEAVLRRRRLDRAALDMVTDGVVVVDRHGRVATINRTARDLLGLGSAPPHEVDLPDLSVNETTVAGRRLRLDAHRLAGGAGTVTVISDVTDRQLTALDADAGPQPAEEEHGPLPDFAQDQAIVTLDPDGNVTSWSGSAERLLGYPEAEILGRPVAAFFRPEDVSTGLPGRLLADARTAGRVETAGPRLRRDGTTIWANTVLTAAIADDGDLRGFVKVIRDDSARHEVEEQLVAADHELRELDRMKTDLTAPASHEPPPEEDTGEIGSIQRRMLDVIDTNGARLLSLVEDLLSFAKVDTGDVDLTAEQVDVETLLATVDTTVRPALPAGLLLDLVVSAAVPPVAADPTHLNRALLSLLSNAVKFSPAGGVITLTGEYDEKEVRMSVRDTGIGIPPDEQARLFQRFFRSPTARGQHIQGTGLGLALVKTIAEAHGGRVTLESEVGRGTCVTLHLPRSPR